MKRDFDAVYAAEADPWLIGDADSERYKLYRELVLRHAIRRGRILDIGSGFGAFLARFRDDFEELDALELSGEAVAKGRERFPFIEFRQGSAEELGGSPVDRDRYDAILYSDVIYYLDEAGKENSLRWIAEHLTDDGLAFVAAWCPGGDYLLPDELRRLVRRALAIEEESILDSGHVAFACRRKRRMVALTLDYETWQPIPEGRQIDWDRDVFAPTAALLDVLDSETAPLTIFAEVGEWTWLRENEPAIAERWEEQLRDALRRGHDVQLHLHPNWLPELGARHENGDWHWDDALTRADDYPGDLAELIGGCKRLLEETLRPVDPKYEVSCFRAGAYEAQPFARLYDALAASGIACDSSVYPGGYRPDRGYDYRLAYSHHQPYFASRSDPQLKAPPAERAVVELPVMTMGPNDRWTFDSDEGAGFAQRLREWDGARAAEAASSEQLRRRGSFGRRLGNAYASLRRRGLPVNRFVPRRLAWTMTGYEREVLAEHDYFVLVGHSKTDLDVEAIARGVRELSESGFELVRLSDMARTARAELERTVSRDRSEEAERQVVREYGAVMGTERNEAQSFRLQEILPLDRDRVLDLGCGAGMWSDRIARLYPWMRVTGIDAGQDFIDKARREYESNRVHFEVADFVATGFADGEFDVVYADNSLEHAFDVDGTLAEVHRLLREGGALVAGIPPDAVNPGRTCDNHTWKTAPHDVRLRLEAAGLTDVTIDEVDTYRELGMPPFPPSGDRMMYIVAWKRDQPAGPWTRAEEIATWIYLRLDPQRSQSSTDPFEVLREGYAWCEGYTLTAGDLLTRARYDLTYVTMEAAGHPRGRGERQLDTHEVLEVRAPSGETRVLDAMSNVWFDTDLRGLLADPARATPPQEPDARFKARGYELYTSPFWYERVDRLSLRRSLSEPTRLVPVLEALQAA